MTSWHGRRTFTLHAQSPSRIDRSAGLVSAVAAPRSDARIEGYIEGKTLLRDRLVALLSCSELEAERLTDTLEARGFLRFRASGRQGTNPGYWELSCYHQVRSRGCIDGHRLLAHWTALFSRMHGGCQARREWIV